MYKSILTLSMSIVFLGLGHSVFAQDTLDAVVEKDSVIVVGNEEPSVKPLSIMEKAKKIGNSALLSGLNPLLFLKDEYRLLLDAKKGVTARAATISEIDANGDAIVDPGRREIVLAGIVYRSASDWTIWFNEQRVTPTAIPEEVIDIKVGKDYIDVKWFDAFTNQIFPVRLRPHERFNLDSRIYLPG